MTDDADERVAAIIRGATEFQPIEPAASSEKPPLLVEPADPERTVAALCEIFANSHLVYDRGLPVRIVTTGAGTVAVPLTADGVVLLTHQISRPHVLKARDGEPPRIANCRFPRSLAQLYLSARSDWDLRPFAGIASTPLLRPDGSIHSTPGYDLHSGCWLEHIPDVSAAIPSRPSRNDAVRALQFLRSQFASFCFADAPTTRVPDIESPLVDTDQPPRGDESAFLAALMTAVCRPSLDLAPGVLIRAASVSGAGSGKGLLARCICLIAYGREPSAVTAGGKLQELEARLAAELMASGPVIFLDNLNDRALKSDLLASALTERPARVRVLGKSEMVPMNATAFVILTGNGLTVSEDLARRFITIDLDPKMEDPEARSFPGNIKNDILSRREELLSALLTIWRWGRQDQQRAVGLPLGSYAQWCEWVRDPLLALGCVDPVARTREAKQRDPRRQDLADLFRVWMDRHGHKPVTVNSLHEDVRQLIDPQCRGRQFIAAKLQRLDGTRIAGNILTRQSGGKWAAATYAILAADDH